MKGNPKYNYGDEVSFKLGDKIYSGNIYIIDKYGTFEDDSDVSYDIMVKDEKYIDNVNTEGKCLFKHINERLIC